MGLDNRMVSDYRRSIQTLGGISFPGFRNFHRQSGKLRPAATREA